MPIIVDPDNTPTLPSQAVSADGRLTVTTYPAGGGVYLYADFSDLNPTPRKVRFVRGQAQIPVRSGDPAWAPGGVAKAFDREAPGGVASAWYAIPIFWDAGVYVEGTMSQGAQVVSPAVDHDRDFWLKSIGTPRQMRIRSTSAATTLPERSLTGRDAGQEIPGQSYRAGGWDVPVLQPVTYIFKTHTVSEYEQLELLLSAGPVLIQQLAAYGVPDEYAKLGSLSWKYQISATRPERVVTVTFNPCRRPPTANSPLYIPGYSWDDGKAAYLSWDHAAGLIDTWDELLITAPPVPDEIIPESGGDGDEGGP